METQAHRETARRSWRRTFCGTATSQGLLAATGGWKSLQSQHSPMSTKVYALGAPALCEDTFPSFMAPRLWSCAAGPYGRLTHCLRAFAHPELILQFFIGPCLAHSWGPQLKCLILRENTPVYLRAMLILPLSTPSVSPAICSSTGICLSTW